MTKRGGAPSKRELDRIAANLTPGERVSVGDSITLTIDSSGRQRFQWRARLAGRGSRQAGGTCDSYAEAVSERTEFLAGKEDGSRRRREKGRMIRIEDYAERHWWPDVLKYTEPMTQLDYGPVWHRDVEPFWKGWTLGEIAEVESFSPYDDWLRERKIHRNGKKKGQVAESAIEKAYRIFGRILGHAVDEGYLDYNPLARANKKRRKQKKRRKKEKIASSSARPIRGSEVPSILQIERLRLHMPGCWPLELAARRALIDVLAYVGLRPGEALFLRHRHWRTPLGPRSMILVEGGLKDVAGHLEPGPTKTHYERDAILWAVVAEALERLYQMQGCPPLESLVFPNRNGDYLRWDNFRQRAFYTALHRAGISTAAEACAPGSFVPYQLRHSAATLMFYVVRPGGDSAGSLAGHYSATDIADHLGNTPQVLLDTYAKVMAKDLQGVGGRTMDEAIRWARREEWGPMPGDGDYVEERLSLVEAAELTGLSVKALGARAQRGTLPTSQDAGKYCVTRFNLLSHGLLLPCREARSSKAA